MMIRSCDESDGSDDEGCSSSIGNRMTESKVAKG